MGQDRIKKLRNKIPVQISPCISSFVAVMVRIKKTCPSSPSYLLDWKKKKVGRGSCWWFVLCSLKYLTNIRLMFFSAGKPTEANVRLYRALCVFLTLICLVLVLVVILLSVKREYLQP